MIDNKLAKRDSGEFMYDFVYVLFKRKRSIIAVFLTTFLGVIFGTFLVIPVWKATAKIQIDINPKQQITLFDDSQAPMIPSSKTDAVNNFIQMLTSREMAERIVKRFNRDEMYRKRLEEPEKLRYICRAFFMTWLVDKPIEFLVEIGLLTAKPKNYLANAVKEMMKDLEDIELEEETGIINISIWGENNKLATGMANTMVSMLMETDLALSLEPNNKLYDFTKNELLRMDKDVLDFEEKIYQYKKHNKVYLMDIQKKTILDRIDEYEDDLRRIISSKKELKGKIKETITQLSEQKPEKHTSRIDTQRTSISEMGNNPQINELTNLILKKKAALAGMLVERKEVHPEVILLKKEIAILTEQLKKEEKRITQLETKEKKEMRSDTDIMNPFYYDLTSRLNNLKLEKHSLTTRKQSKIKAIKTLGKELLLIPDKELKLSRLDKQLAIKQRIHLDLKSKFEELKVMRNFPLSDFNIKVIDKAHVYDFVPPDWPKWVINLPAGLVVSLLMGIGFAFFLDYWDSSFKSVKELEEELKLPVFGSLPMYR